MNKPDFEQIASSKSEIQDHDSFLGFVAGCEQVWNAHVIPLAEWKEKHIQIMKTQGYGGKIESLESENKLLREELTDKSKTCADLTILLSDEKEKVSTLREEIQRLKAEKSGTVLRISRCTSSACTWPNCECSKF